MSSFPSDEWFVRLTQVADDDPQEFERLGFADLRLVIEVTQPDGVRRFGIVLDGYQAVYAGELDDVGAFSPDVTLTGPLDVWTEMVDSIDRNGGADGGHTLNRLTMAGVPLTVRAEDPMGRDKFFRYAETLQALFDGTAAHPVGA